ncbi:T9SS type A sorting domain-containing protein [Subsaxibacter sp. CAU 1640]|uniref:T9SS-dependent choice-of-anchor J family protein n=1 Tax=Subsaxibacter sp. CAU 1640 TaxID=2933271 RepID=UPI002002ABD2|nr:choice-of-anchor J domain-containing protein [Subsaxibacter sp. CAU 1640]MCK7590241.1 T9SS type A sorting domain-containing protein [Subsaxibacter sp. CAU 1640]
MKKIYFLLLTLAFSFAGFGQTQIINQALTNGSLPAGWTQVDVTFTTSAGGYANFTTNSAILTTPIFNSSLYSSVRVDFDVAKFGTGGDGPLRLEYSINGGSNWLTASNSTTPTDSNYQSNSITINAVSANMRIRFNRAPSPSQKRLRNVIVYGIGSAACTPPSTQATAYNTTNRTSNSGTLNWTRGNGNNVLVVMRQGSAVNTDPTNGTSYTANAAFGSGTQIGTGNYVVYNGPGTSVNVTGLSAESTYHVAVYEYATTGTCYNNTELTGNFTTLCSTVYSLPFTEGFESGVPPTCWTQFTGANTLGVEQWQSDSRSYIGSAAALINFENSVGTTQDWLVTPAIDMSGLTDIELSFFGRELFNEPPDLGNTYTVRVSTTTPVISSFTNIVETYTEADFSLTYTNKTIDLSAYSGQTIYIAFVMEQNSGDGWLIDNISIDTPNTGCTFPALQATNFTATNIDGTAGTATVSWFPGNGNATLVVLKEGSAVDVDPSSGTSYTANSAFGTGEDLGSGNYVVYSGAGTSVNISNLTVDTEYFVAVYSYYTTGNCYNTNELAGTFSTGTATGCNAYTLPFTEGFEGGNIPTCWEVFENGEAGNNQWTVNSNDPYNGSNFSAYLSFDAGTTSGVNRDWLITPPIDLSSVSNAELSFYTYTSGDPNDTFVSNFSVRVSTASQTNLNDFTSIPFTNTESQLGATYNQKIIDLSSYAGQVIYIAFVSEQNFPDGGEEWFIDDISITAPTNSADSDIVEAGFDEPDNIDYLSYSAANGLTTANAIKIGEFTIRDGGSVAPDSDSAATTLTDLGFTVQNFGDIAALAIFDGTTNVSEVSTVAATTNFTGLNLVAPDNDTKTFSIYATFDSSVTDNNQIQLTIASATATGSTFAAANAGGAQTSVAGDDNRIEVTATELVFDQQPTDTDVNAVMSPSPTVVAVDANANTDLDYVTVLSLSTTGTFAGTATTSVAPVSGVATFDNLIFSAVGTGFTLTTVSGLTNDTSTAFDILAIPTFGWQIDMVNQFYTIDFDNTVTNVTNGAYTGAGFTPTPNAGQLNSGAWAVNGLEDGTLNFGGTQTGNDFAKNTSAGGVTSGGLYSFEVASNNFSFGIQPSGSDFTPGTIVLRTQNQTGQTVTAIDLQYTIYVNNNESRGNTFNFAYSVNNSTYIPESSLDYTSPVAPDSNGWIAVNRNISITGLNIASGDYFYLRWFSDDLPSGSGSRDEFGLDDITVVFNPLVTDNDSNIVATSFDESDNIDYITYNAASGLTTANAIKIGEFSIQDGGDTMSDADNLSTTLTDVSFDVQNFGSIAALAIFDGTTNVSEVTSVTATTGFSGLTLEALDNGSKVFDIYATFSPAVTDNSQVQLTISTATAALTGSGFADADAGGAQTSVAGDDNRLEVIATTLGFVQQPSDVNINQTMDPAVTVTGVDANGNADADFSGTVSLTTTSTFSGTATTSVSSSGGIATFTNLGFSTIGTATLTASSAGLLDSAPSNTFEVTPATRSFWYEPFTDNSQYTVTAGGEGNDGNSDYFQITDGSNIDKTYTGNSGNFFAAQDIDDGGWAGSASPSQLTWSNINIERYTSLTFSGKFASIGGGIDDNDYVIVEYQIDGGGWVNLIAFENDGTPFNTDLREDTNFDGTGDGTLLTSAFQTFSKAISTTGAILDIRVTMNLDSGNEDVALEDFKLAGVGTVFYGNAATGFGGPIGNSTLEVYASSGITVNFVYNRGTSDFNDYMVIYIDSETGGITTTSGLTDTGDDGRKAISGYDGTNRSTINFPPGFQPDYAISMNNGFAGLFEIAEGGSHNFIQSANLAPTGSPSATIYTFNINFSNINTVPGLESFKFLATYLNGGNAFRSNESIGRNNAGASNPGYGTMQMETYFEVSSALQGGFAPTQATGTWTADGTWLNGNPPLITDDITIGHDTDQNIDVAVDGMTINAALDILPSYTLSTSDGLTGSGSLNVFGKLSITQGGFTDISPVYNVGSTLEYKDIAAVYNRYNEWNLGAAPANVIVDNADLDMTNLSINPNGTEDFNVGNNLSIINGGSLTVAPVKSITIGNTISNDGTVNLNSNSTRYSSLIAGSAIGSGTYNYNRHINGQPGIGVGTGANDLVSAPVTGQTFADFASANPNLRQNPSQTTQKVFGPFDKATGTYLLWDTAINGGEILTAGVGYRAASTDNNGFLFSGDVNTGTVTYNIENSGPQFAIYNLIGNPYPSYLNVREFLEYEVAAGVANIDLMQNPLRAIYGYDGDASGTGGDGWVIYNLNTATDVNLAPGQGFLVTANVDDVAAYDITFDPSMRRVDSTDDFIPGRLANENNVHLRLQAGIGASNYKTDFYFNDNSTSGLDSGYDAGVFGSNAASKSIYSHLVSDNTGVDMAIQSLAYDALGSDIIIPLGINVPQGQQVTVSIAESTLPSNIDVYLEDALTTTFTLLNSNDYVFTPNTNLTDTGRFYLRFTDNTLSNGTTDLDKIQIYTLDQTLHINGLLNAESTVKLFDIQGRQVLAASLESGSSNNIVDVSSVSTGVYIVKLNNKTQQKTQRVIIK